MHHQKAGRQLSRNTPHRKAMFRNMVDSLMEYERIETTLPKAKELRKYAERVITLGKKGTLHARRRVMTLIRRKETMRKVFDQLAQRFTDRPGGYTRIYRLGPRKSDQTPMALVELLDQEGSKEKKTKKGVSKKASPKKAAKNKLTEPAPDEKKVKGAKTPPQKKGKVKNQGKVQKEQESKSDRKSGTSKEKKKHKK